MILKEGPLWDEARSIFKKKELTLEKNEDMVVLDRIRELRSQFPDIHKFYENFSDEVTNVSVSAHKSGWMMFINFRDSVRSFGLDSDIFIHQLYSVKCASEKSLSRKADPLDLILH